MTEPELKQKLIEWAALDFELPAQGMAFAIISEHLDCLGSLDPELRDALFYEAVDAWISRGLLDQEQLAHLTVRLVSSGFLFKGIGEQAGTDVFRRTFSALILDAIVRQASGSGQPNPVTIETIALSLERYAKEERDLRGYVVPFGWTHSVAHAADVLASLMASPDLPGWSSRILASLQELLCKSRHVYTHQEDKRLARVLVAHCLHHQNRRAELLAWMDEVLQACPPSFSDMELYARRTNLLDLLRAFYFYLHAKVEEAELAVQIETRIRLLMRIPSP